MPLDTPPEAAQPPVAHRAARLNVQLRHHAARDVIATALDAVDRLALVSSFGAESVVLLHLASRVDPDIPVLFIDTRMLFAETLAYQRAVAQKLGLRKVITLRAEDAAQTDPDGTLHQTNPDACCTLRKTAPLDAALAGYDGWITGRKRFHSTGRATLPHFEAEDSTNRIKVNPLAFWSRDDVADYITENNLPRHPLVKAGYSSIGCAPCTTPTKPGEDPRAGRWRSSDKDECGIHFANGKAIRQGEQT